MANAFQNPVMYTQGVLRALVNNIVLGKQVNRSNQDQFGKDEMKIGDTINVRRPARFTVSTGQTFAAQDYTETSIPLVVNLQKHIDTAFTSSDMTLKLQDLSDRLWKPAGIQIAQQIDIDGYLNAKNTVGNLTGTAGTSPNALSFLTDVGKKLDDFSTPRDGNRFIAMDQGSNASMIQVFPTYFNPTSQISEQYKEGVFLDGTNTFGAKLAMSQNVARHTVGALGGSPVVNGAAQSLVAGWANTGTLVTNGWTAAALQRVNAGDIFTIANVSSVNPITRQANTALLQVVVTTAASSDASGNLTLTFSPAIITAGPFQNATAAPVNGAALTFIGTAATSYARNIAWHKDAFQLAVVPMVDLGKFGGWGSVQTQENFSLRVFRQAAISNDTVGNSLAALYGWATLYPEQATQQVSA